MPLPYVAPENRFRVVLEGMEDIDYNVLDFDTLAEAVEAAKEWDLAVYDDKGAKVFPPQVTE